MLNLDCEQSLFFCFSSVVLVCDLSNLIHKRYAQLAFYCIAALSVFIELKLNRDRIKKVLNDMANLSFRADQVPHVYAGQGINLTYLYLF